MPPIEVQITVAGRVGPALESVFTDLDAQVSLRHTVVLVGSGRMPDVLRLLKALEERDLAIDRILGPPR